MLCMAIGVWLQQRALPRRAGTARAIEMRRSASEVLEELAESWVEVAAPACGDGMLLVLHW